MFSKNKKTLNIKLIMWPEQWEKENLSIKNFQEKWESQYFCTTVDGKIHCLICKCCIATPKEYNLKRHVTNHRVYDKYEGPMRVSKKRSWRVIWHNNTYALRKFIRVLSLPLLQAMNSAKWSPWIGNLIVKVILQSNAL